MKVRVYEVRAAYEVEVPDGDCSEPVLREAVAKVQRGEVVPVSTSRTHVAVPLSAHHTDARDVVRALCSVPATRRLAAARQAGINVSLDLDESSWVVTVVSTAASMGRLGALLAALRSTDEPKSLVWG